MKRIFFSTAYILEFKCTHLRSHLAQHQMPSYPGLPRGLVAVLLYYDGHKALATALRTIMQARSGFHWTVDISSNIPDYLAKYSDELVAEGLLEKVLGMILYYFTNRKN